MILQEELLSDYPKFKVLSKVADNGRGGEHQGGRPDPRPHTAGEGAGEGECPPGC